MRRLRTDQGGYVNPEEFVSAATTGRQPVTGHEDPDGDLRVFAIQYRLDLVHATSVGSYRDAMRALMDELVVPHLIPGRPALVVFPEAVGLPVVAIGERGAAIRTLAAGPMPPMQEVPVALIQGMTLLAEANRDRLGAYTTLLGTLDPRSAIFIAATDTAARAFSRTFSDIARDYGVWIVAGNYQAPYRESKDADEIAAFGEPGADEVFVATVPELTNATYIWGPVDVNPDAPTGERNLLARNEKIPLTQIESDLLGLVEGASEGDPARKNAGWVDVAGFHVGFATSLPAFQYGYPFAERPAGYDAFADIREGYAAAQDELGVDLMVQADANPGPWAVPAESGAWQPLEWMGSTWRAVADPTVRFRYNVTPMMTGNLLDLAFDGQSTITARGDVGEPRSFVGNTELGEGDLDEYRSYVGPKHEFLAMSPWVVEDAPREQLTAVSLALAPGSGSALENGYIETALFADLRRTDRQEPERAVASELAGP
jgi:hypothetical protein